MNSLTLTAFIRSLVLITAIVSPVCVMSQNVDSLVIHLSRGTAEQRRATWEKLPENLKKIEQPIIELLYTLNREGIDSTDYARASKRSKELNLGIEVDNDGLAFLTIRVENREPTTFAGLVAAGVRIHSIDTSINFIHSWVPFHKIEKLSFNQFVLFISKAPRAFSRTGSENTEGDDGQEQ